MSIPVAQLPGAGHPKSGFLMQVGILGAWLIRVIVHEGVGLWRRRGVGNATTSMGDRIGEPWLPGVIVDEGVGLQRCQGVGSAATCIGNVCKSLIRKRASGSAVTATPSKLT